MYAALLSLWGNVADFNPGCSHWRLKPGVSIPALQEFTVCFSLKFEDVTSSPWTAFMYRHPDVQYAELGFGGKQGLLVVWLFGTEWTTAEMRLHVSQWHSLCLTWTHTKDRPALYIDGELVEITAAHNVETPSITPSCRKLAPNGTLTLGASHFLVDGNIKIIPFTTLLGKLSQFRLWGREQEVTSLKCAEGDLVKWEPDNWDSRICAVPSDPSLQCEWSFYKLRLMFVIMRFDGNKTELYKARDIAHKWLRKVLPSSMYLPRVSVFEVLRSSSEESDVKTSPEDGLVRWAPSSDRFHCLVHINVIPPLDVATVQTEMYTDLRKPYTCPGGQLQLWADPASIHITPVESFTATTTSPPDVVTSPVTTTLPITTTSTTTSTSTSAATTTSSTAGPTGVSELYFEVRVNVSITGSYDPEQIISTWLNSSLPDDMMIVLDLQMLPQERKESCVFRVQCTMSLSETHEMEELIRALLLMPYDNGSISIETQDIQISRIWNALDVIEMIVSLLKNQSTLNYKELATVLNKLEDILNLSVVTPNLGQALINIISDILESDSDLLPFTNTILNITEAVGDTMVGYEGSSTLVAPAIALSVVDVVPGQFNSLTFGVKSHRVGTTPEIFINRYPLNGTVAFISLPSVLQHSFPQHSSNQSPPRVTFQFFGIPMLFKTSQKGAILNTFVVSASVTNASSPIKDLDEDVKVTLQHLIPNTDASRTPLDPVNEQILTIITYVGCGVSSLFLGITVLTYTAFEKLRRDYPSQILINLSLALLGLNLVFLVNSWLSSWGIYGLCVAAASMLHYFLLASFTWMGLEAVNMYFALVKVFNVYVPSYILKFCALGWGLPLAICILVLIVNREAYGSHLYTDAQPSLEPLDNSDNFCWLQDDVTFYVSVVAYAALIFLFNIAVFVVVLIQIRHMQTNSPAGTRSGLMHDLKGVASLTLLLGLTWTVGFFTWGPARIVLLYLFSGLNSLQGLFIFLFHCLMKENVRRQWRIHLCFGRFRLEEHSEWSNSASVGVVAKPKSNPPRASVPSVRSVKSSSTDSTSASSDSSQRESSCKRPNLGFFVNSLAIPRAQRSPSGTGAAPHQRGMNPTPGWRNHLLQQEQR
uniref:adhesion G-protein coupled receptor G6 n=1 Tax=Semicossyphus pulcher TaxID=241346 RepID=UPI0037E99C34